MTAFIALVFFVAVAVIGFAVRHWLSGRLKDHAKKQDDDGVEIVVQKPVHERRLKLALPDLSYVQIRSPVGPMKSSIRSALKELRSRQMVQSLCSRFETGLKVPTESDESSKKKSVSDAVAPTRSRRRDASVIPAPSPTGLASGLAREAEITANARSNNLNKFLRSYASNLDNAISAERRVVMSTDAISAERSIVMSTDADDDVEQPLLAEEEEIDTPVSKPTVDKEDDGMELELDLHTLQLESEYSNQVDSPATADSEEEVPVLVEATDCEPLLNDTFDESEEGNNNSLDTSSRLSKAFTPTDIDSTKHSVPESARPSDTKPELCIPPALARFKQQVPSNGRRARHLTTLNI